MCIVSCKVNASVVETELRVNLTLPAWARGLSSRVKCLLDACLCLTSCFHICTSFYHHKSFR